MNQHALREVLGHASLKQTERYAKVTSDLKRKGMDAYNKGLADRGMRQLPEANEGGWKMLENCMDLSEGPF